MQPATIDPEALAAEQAALTQAARAEDESLQGRRVAEVTGGSPGARVPRIAVDAMPSALVPPGLSRPATVAAMAGPGSAAGVDRQPVAAMPVGPAPALHAPAPSVPSVPPATKRAAPSPAVAQGDEPAVKPGNRGVGMSLAEAVRQAVGDNALIGIGQGRVAEALAGIGVSRSSLYPQIDVSLASGQDTIGNYKDTNADDGLGYFSTKKSYGAWRSDATLTGRQLIYDFGATSADISRAGAVHDSEELKLQDQTEEIAQNVTDTFLRILQQRELIGIANDNVAALQTILTLLGENEKAGNATLADTKRVRARLIDAQTMKADAESELQAASDRFERLVHVEPGSLRAPPLLGSTIPDSVTGAIAQMRKGNPAIRASEMALNSARLELKSQIASTLPKIQLESEVSGQTYRTNQNYSTLDAKLMVALRYKITDGGLQSSQSNQLRAKALQAEMKMRDTAEQVEADLRQFYRVLTSARAKRTIWREGTADAGKARQLYEEQYKGAKRTLLELLDVQTAYFQARTAEVLNRFDATRQLMASCAASAA